MDDAALFTGRFPGGAVASFEATRVAAGRKNALRIEINGDRAAASPSIWSASTNWTSTTTPRRPRRRASAGSWSPNPTIAISRGGGRPVTDSATTTPSCIRHAICCRPSSRTGTPSRPSPTGCRCSGCWPRWSAAPRTAACGRPSSPRRSRRRTCRWLPVPTTPSRSLPDRAPRSRPPRGPTDASPTRGRDRIAGRPQPMFTLHPRKGGFQGTPDGNPTGRTTFIPRPKRPESTHRCQPERQSPVNAGAHSTMRSGNTRLPRYGARASFA
ncbi:hypothetical protein [Streptomyces sp. NPDC059916]|uniref:hypothetical protein n=1 Tax=Streptomyces sp. NPDC059916 TaxID=3347001 RepID=UPI00368C7A52